MGTEMMCLRCGYKGPEVVHVLDKHLCRYCLIEEFKSVCIQLDEHKQRVEVHLNELEHIIKALSYAPPRPPINITKVLKKLSRAKIGDVIDSQLSEVKWADVQLGDHVEILKATTYLHPQKLTFLCYRPGVIMAICSPTIPYPPIVTENVLYLSGTCHGSACCIYNTLLVNETTREFETYLRLTNKTLSFQTIDHFMRARRRYK